LTGLIRHWRIAGPGLVVTAAFIGPGTVTTASQAGATYGYSLLWVLLVATGATIVLQNLAARIGLVTKSSLGQAIRQTLPWPPARWAVAGLAVLAIGCGNSAFQAGNLTGARVGLEIMTGVGSPYWVLVLGAVASSLLLLSDYRRMELALMAMVLVMSLGFLLTAVLAAPSPWVIAAGIVPRVPEGSILTALGLLGTTLVPYNLFLHAGLVRAKWAGFGDSAAAGQAAHADTILSVSLGGIVSIAILVTAAAAFFGTGQTLSSIRDLPQQLEPLLGSSAARVLFGLGLFAAGLTSAITAPLAAAIAISGVSGWTENLTSWGFRSVWSVVMIVGVIVALFWNQSPIQIILAAQAFNAILLPTMVGLLIYVSHVHPQMRTRGPSLVENGAAGLVLGVVLLLTGHTIYRLLFS
jgi:manganese transport protein